MPYGYDSALDALKPNEPNQANTIWVEEEPTPDTIDSDYVYMWVDPADNQLTANSLDESGSLQQIKLEVTVSDGDTGLIGGLL